MSFDYARFGIHPGDDWCSLIFCSVYAGRPPPRIEWVKDPEKEPSRPLPIGWLYVIDSRRPNALYKMAGGGKECGESPEQTAVREFYEETGIRVPADRFYAEAVWWQNGRVGPYADIVFSVSISKKEYDKRHSRHPMNEGEISKLFKPSEYRQYRRLGLIMPKHDRGLIERGLLIP